MIRSGARLKFVGVTHKTHSPIQFHFVAQDDQDATVMRGIYHKCVVGGILRKTVIVLNFIEVQSDELRSRQAGLATKSMSVFGAR